jgi:serpin B
MRPILLKSFSLYLALASSNSLAQSPGDVGSPPTLRIEFPDFPTGYQSPDELRPLRPTITPTASAPPIAPHERATLSDDAYRVVAGNNRFALDIYRSLSGESGADKNLLVSPFSISAALAMTYAGARGQTAQQMAGVLGFTLPNDRLHSAFGELLQDLTVPRDGYQLSIANRLFGQAGYPFENAFLDTTSRNYGAPLEALDFRHGPDGARRRINQWVENQTNDKIRDLLPGGSIKDNTRLVLTNAIYFDGSWKNKFYKQLTGDQAFFGTTGQSQVSMMHQLHSFGYAERSGYQLLEMPYAGDDMSLVVMLPDAHDGLSNLEASLTTDELKAGLGSMYSTSVNVSLPKFTFDSSFKLADALKAMGMTDAFSKARADLRGIADPPDEKLYIDEALHKAFIDVNEEGTEAAAATAVIIGAVTTCMCAPPPPKTFDADHPFLFALRDVHSGSLLFFGRVVDPAALTALAPAPVPEPASIGLMVMGIILVAGKRRRRF